MKNKELNDKTLYVFDLDDTLIKTTARIRAIHSDGSLEMLTSHQYSELADYSDIKSLDYSEFNSGTLLMSEAIKPLIGVFAGLIYSGCNVLLLTAREDYDIIDDWIAENTKFGLTQIRTKLAPVHGPMLHCVHDPLNEVVSPELPTPLAKKKFLEYVINKGGYENIHLFDDSSEICKNIKSLERENIKLKVTVHPV